MSSIWGTTDSGWQLLAPVGFPDEKTLHSLVQQTPELLPLAGSPSLVVLGSEVSLGGGYADILAVEPNGRLVLIEVKLASNGEARRAVVAQILAYAAFLRGTTLEELEGGILRVSLSRQGTQTIGSLVEAQDKEGSYDPGGFAAGIEGSLANGRFRLVLVLDDAPPELVRLVGYLEEIAPELVIDLITVTAYEVEGKQVLVPQRVDPERPEPRVPTTSAPSTQAKQGHLISPEEFLASIDPAPAVEQVPLRRMYEWARRLEAEGVIRLLAFRGATGITTLLPYLINDEAGLITVWNNGSFSMSFWRSVFERRAPDWIPKVEALIAPAKLGQGNTVKAVDEALLQILADTYRSTV
jgi:hypothetical protein